MIHHKKRGKRGRGKRKRVDREPLRGLFPTILLKGKTKRGGYPRPPK